MSRVVKILMLVGAIIAGIVAALMMHGCATTKAVIADCLPVTESVASDITDVFDNATLSNAEDVLKLEGLGVAFCVITDLAKKAVAFAKAEKAAATAPNFRQMHAQAWLEVHP